MRKQLAFLQPGWPVVPYLYFCGLAAFWFFNEVFTNQHVSFVALGILLLLMLQAIRQNKAVAVFLGVVAILANTYFFLAVISEFSEFEIISRGALELLGVGSLLSLGGLAMGILMVVKDK